MKKFIKIAATLLVIIIVLAVIAPSLIPEKVLKEKLIAQVEANTGLSLSINGEMQTHFFPAVGASLTDVSLFDKVNPTKPIITLKSMDARVALLPLLSKEVVLRKLTMEEPVINLHVDASGNRNWIVGPVKKPDNTPQPTAKKNRSNPDVNELHIGGVKISNGSVHYHNEMTGQKWDLNKLELSISMDGMHAPMDLEGKGEWQKKMVSVDATFDTLHAFLSGNEAEVKLSVKSELLEASLIGSMMGGTFGGAAAVNSKSLKQLQEWVDPSVKSSLPSPMALDLKGDTKCSAQSCEFTNAHVQLDNLKATGKASVDLAGRVPYVNVELATEELDLNPFLPPEPKTNAMNLSLVSDAQAAGNNGWSREPMDFSVLKDFNATANIKTKGLLVRKIKIGNAIFRAKLDKGRLSADIVNAQLYGGKGDFTVVIDANNDVVEKRVNITGVQAEPFLKDAMNEDHVSGTLNAQMNVIGRGRSQYDIISNLQGVGAIKFTDGAIKGINIADMVRNVQSAFKPVDRSSQKTDFAELGGTINITNGIVKNTDLAMKAPLMRLSGAGQVDLPARTINYRLKPEIVQTIQGQGGKEKEGLGVPILIGGTLDNPTYTPDLKGVVEDAIKDPQKIKDAVKDVKEQFKGEKKKETLKNIRGLLKGN